MKKKPEKSSTCLGGYFRVITLLLLFSGKTFVAFSQTGQTDSLKQLLAKSGEDSNRASLLYEVALTYRFTKPDSSILLMQEVLRLSEKLNYTIGKINALNAIGESLRSQSEYPLALEKEFEALRLSRDNRDSINEARGLTYIGIVYVEMGEFQKGLQYLFEGLERFENLQHRVMMSFASVNIGNAYEKMGKPDSALFFMQKAESLSKTLPNPTLRTLVLGRMGIVLAGLGHYDQAFQYYRQAIQSTTITGDMVNRSRSQYQMAELFIVLNQPDSAYLYAQQALASGQQVSQRSVLLNTSSLLAKFYKSRNRLDSALYYQELATAVRDSMFGPEKFHRLQLLTTEEQQRQQEMLQEQIVLKNRIRLYSLFAALLVFLLLAIILYRNNRQKQKTNALLQHQNTTIQQSMTELKAAQSQLIQSEKMASLGELTAGIAHEIQNPLNFITNFSEINNELIDELKTKNSGEQELLHDIYQNNEKIIQHGKRADGIVKGMLQHSRTSTGQKESTDINALADEYLRLAYHGLRAKDKSFNVQLKTDFDNSIGKVNVVPQDIGRVLLNLFNNAFYAINEKKKTAGNGYEPTVTVITKKEKDKISISITDNGNGIAQNMIGKIFQPFFTTKPTGQGTGLGLSLSYDSIKAHGGEIKVNSKQHEYSTFIVILPFNTN